MVGLRLREGTRKKRGLLFNQKKGKVRLVKKKK